MHVSKNGCHVWNLTDEKAAFLFAYTPMYANMIVVVFPCILVAGLIGNMGMLLVIIRVPWMRTITNVYLTNLAVADALFLVSAVGEKVWRYVASPVYGDRLALGLVGSLLICLLSDLASAAGMFMITLVSMEKFLAICRPFKHRSISSRRRALKLTLVAWLTAAAFAAAIIPSSLGSSLVCPLWPETEGFANHPSHVAFFSSDENPLSGAYSSVLQTSPFLLVVIPNLLFYVSIIKKLRRPSSLSANRRATRNRNQMVWMLVAGGFVLIICRTPFHVLSVVDTVYYLAAGRKLEADFSGREVLGVVTQVMLYLNSAINPVVYNVANARYRLAFRQALLCRRVRGSNGRPASDALGPTSVSGIVARRQQKESWQERESAIHTSS